MGLSEGSMRNFQFTTNSGEATSEGAINASGRISDEKDEQFLWSKFKQGNEEAFSALYKRYIVDLFNYGEIITSDHELIEDSIHDLFVDLWNKRDAIAQASSVRFYLYKGLKRKIVKNLKKKRKIPLKDSFKDHDFEIVLSHDFGLIAREISDLQKQSLLKAMNQLTPRQKEAIVLRFYDGLDFIEIAELLEISKKSTYTLIYRALSVIRGNMKNILLWLIFIHFYYMLF
jgi:RNA polymerase sigma factor (sigma-70 family)